MKKMMALICCLCMLMSQVALAEDTALSTPPPMPEGNMQPGDMNGTPPELPNGGMGTPPEGLPEGIPEGGMGGPGGFGGSGQLTQGTAATTLAEDTTVTGGTFSSTEADENALRVTGSVHVVLDGIAVEKSGGDTSNTEDSDFYGQNAGLLATDGANLTIADANLTTDASGGNAVFSYGQGTNVTIESSTIRTRQNNSGGIHVAGGGTLTASGLDVETQDNSAAAIRSDRGGGTLVADGGSYVTNGTGSPAVYSTAAVTVKNAALTANHSEAVVVEGKNSVSLENCVVTGNMSGTYADGTENLQAVMIYQSMSGDADVGKSHFSMAGGSLTSLNGDMIYITNTSCTVELKNVALSYANENLLRVMGNSSSRGWGKEGANGGQCVFTAESQAMEGIITVDEISSLDMTMMMGTAFTGTINPDGQCGIVNVTVDDTSTWTLTADAYVTSFTGNMDNVVTNGYTLRVEGA